MRDRKLNIALTVAAAMLVGSSIAANASDITLLSCYVVDQYPPHANDAIAKTVISFGSSPASAKPMNVFTVVHTMKNGREYVREEQYKDYQIDETENYAQWSGVLRSDNSMTMVGRLIWMGAEQSYDPPPPIY